MSNLTVTQRKTVEMYQSKFKWEIMNGKTLLEKTVQFKHLIREMRHRQGAAREHTFSEMTIYFPLIIICLSSLDVRGENQLLKKTTWTPVYK